MALDGLVVNPRGSNDKQLPYGVGWRTCQLDTSKSLFYVPETAGINHEYFQRFAENAIPKKEISDGGGKRTVAGSESMGSRQEPGLQMDFMRRGGREKTELRALKVDFDGLARVDGSARFGFGDTVVVASVSGPIEVRLAAENPSLSTFEVLHRPLSNVPATQSKFLAASIRAALIPSLILSQNPRTLIQLVVQALSPIRSKSSDALVAAMINASTIALLNAGSIPMKGVVCAVAIGRIKSALIVDQDEEEERVLDASGCFAFAFGNGIDDARCVWTNWKSPRSFDQAELTRCKLLASVAAKSVWLQIQKRFEGDESGQQEDEMEV
ncbi:ribosomal protein S5 domain 2-type protein [Mycena haematopus]|nr:ribosomal protein S5 domain 2-type protein [Mycena haematopus]